MDGSSKLEAQRSKLIGDTDDLGIEKFRDGGWEKLILDIGYWMPDQGILRFYVTATGWWNQDSGIRDIGIEFGRN